MTTDTSPSPSPTTGVESESESEYLILSPPEYVKFANERESKIRKAAELSSFIEYLRNEHQMLTDLTELQTDSLIANYLAAQFKENPLP